MKAKFRILFFIVFLIYILLLNRISLNFRIFLYGILHTFLSQFKFYNITERVEIYYSLPLLSFFLIALRAPPHVFL